jgi:hypothetical protein
MKNVMMATLMMVMDVILHVNKKLVGFALRQR